MIGLSHTAGLRRQLVFVFLFFCFPETSRAGCQRFGGWGVKAEDLCRGYPCALSPAPSLKLFSSHTIFKILCLKTHKYFRDSIFKTYLEN